MLSLIIIVFPSIFLNMAAAAAYLLIFRKVPSTERISNSLAEINFSVITIIFLLVRLSSHTCIHASDVMKLSTQIAIV